MSMARHTSSRRFCNNSRESDLIKTLVNLSHVTSANADGKFTQQPLKMKHINLGRMCGILTLMNVCRLTVEYESSRLLPLLLAASFIPPVRRREPPPERKNRSLSERPTNVHDFGVGSMLNGTGSVLPSSM
jgi:hypothetical protein